MIALFILLLAKPCFVFADTNQCLKLFGNAHHSLNEVTSTEFAPKSSFKDFRQADANQTVYTVRRTKTHIVLRKAKDQAWYSDKNMIDGTATPQGDPRAIVLIAGTKIGKYLGFRLTSGPDFVELHVPLVHYFKSKLEHLNQLLIDNEQEPIAFNLKKTGLATDREIVGLSRQKRNQSHFHFPFDDVDPNLLIHEYSFHLGGILFPNSIIRKASLVSDRLVEFLNSIEKNPDMKTVVQILLAERKLQLDAGTARITVTLLMLRYVYPELTFSEIAEQIDLQTHPQIFNILRDALRYLTQSSSTPAGSVALGVVDWIGVGRDLAPTNWQQSYHSMSQLLLHLHKLPKLSDVQKDYLTKALRNFIQKYSSEFANFNQEQSDKDLTDPNQFLKAIDERIQSIEKILPP